MQTNWFRISFFSLKNSKQIKEFKLLETSESVKKPTILSNPLAIIPFSSSKLKFSDEASWPNLQTAKTLIVLGFGAQGCKLLWVVTSSSVSK